MSDNPIRDKSGKRATRGPHHEREYLATYISLPIFTTLIIGASTQHYHVRASRYPA
jgi:hypothetical protein